MSALLEVEGVSKRFGALVAVNEVSFSVERGQIFGVAGPNGSGKSTLFNVLTGIPFGPDRGHVRFLGRAIERMPAHEIARQGLARTFQRDAVFPSLTVRQNAALAAIYGRGKDASRKAVEEALVFCGLRADRFDRPAGEISVFEKKRLTIATALLTDPAMLLLDEPASGLSGMETRELEHLILAIRDRGATVLVIEHVLSLLLAVSEHLVVLEQGAVIARGAPADVMRDPRVIEAYLGRRAKGGDVGAVH